MRSPRAAFGRLSPGNGKVGGGFGRRRPIAPPHRPLEAGPSYRESVTWPFAREPAGGNAGQPAFSRNATGHARSPSKAAFRTHPSPGRSVAAPSNAPCDCGHQARWDRTENRGRAPFQNVRAASGGGPKRIGSPFPDVTAWKNGQGSLGCATERLSIGFFGVEVTPVGASVLSRPQIRCSPHGRYQSASLR